MRIGYSTRYSPVAVEKALVALNESFARVEMYTEAVCPKMALRQRCRAIVNHDRFLNALS